METDEYFGSYAELVRLFYAFRRGGIRIRVTGRFMDPELAAQILTAWDARGSYMADFIADEKGRVREVRFDRIDGIRRSRRERLRRRTAAWENNRMYYN